MIEYIFGGLLLAMALFLIVAVMMQSGKDKKLSGAIGGGADTFFNKGKATRNEKKLARLTTVVAILFAISVIVMYIVVS
ncbi:MAG: preprotein translocase subunit SecG [Clostridia bacterium]|nr:preprotein translocase subunit SecG [Clostridia bacterium]